ncbi:DUF2089 family protein, partial [Nonomuraea sp. NPDC055795]
MDWQELTNLTQGQPFVVERVRLTGSGIAIEGDFELPQLAQLNVEDQVFITVFVRCHGSIKEMLDPRPVGRRTAGRIQPDPRRPAGARAHQRQMQRP